jgi:hypothetical protein
MEAEYTCHIKADLTKVGIFFCVQSRNDNRRRHHLLDGVKRLLPVAVTILILWPRADASARRLEVGPQTQLKSPSAAAAVALDGDEIIIAPGYTRTARFGPPTG